MNEFIVKAGNTPLPDVFLLLLAKHYLSERDCVSLVVSGASDRFTFLFWNKRKRLAISQCHFLSTVHCKQLFQKHLSPLLLTTFDASHVYWIAAQTLANVVVQMHNLLELQIQDTKLSLFHLLQIFKSCKNIVKLSLSLLETNLDSFQEVPESFLEGFGRLNHLKIFTINQSEKFSGEIWLVTLGVLSWCRDCVHLYIETVYSQNRDIDSRVIEEICQKFEQKLVWMKCLESLAIIPRPQDDYDYSYHNDPFVLEILDWAFGSQELLPPSLKRLWIPQEFSFDQWFTIDHPHTPFVKSLCLWGSDNVHAQLNHPKFSQMEHLSDMDFSNSLAHMTHLEYANGRCVDDEGLSEFCKDHPHLKYLYFNTAMPVHDEYHNYLGLQDYLIGNGDFVLHKLKTLGYYSLCGPSQLTMGLLIEKCPNIEILVLAVIDGDTYSGMTVTDYNHLSRIQFHYLSTLTLFGFEMGDGDFLVPVVQQCPKLRSLIIDGYFTPGVFFSNLAKCLPFAKNLRDLQMKSRIIQKFSTILLFLKNILVCSDHLERLVLDHRGKRWWAPKLYLKCSPELEDLLVGFASEMDHLRALCFSGFRVAPNVVRKVNRRVKKEVLPHRPEFWFYLGQDLPNCNDATVPRIHMQEIINPINVFCPASPPS